MNITRRTHGRCAFAGLVALVIACHDATRPPESGSIRITTVTTGFDADADGYVVTVDSGATHALEPNGSLTLDARGTLRINTTTTGLDADPDGYTASALGYSSLSPTPVPLDGTVSLDVPANLCPTTEFGCGYRVSLSGVAANCMVGEDGVNGTTRFARVASGSTVDVAFAVTCAPLQTKRLPAGSQLAFVRDGRIHLVNSDGTGVVSLTDGPEDGEPAWSPDGRRIAFPGSRNGEQGIYVMDADGSSVVRLIRNGWSPTWSPDGKRIAFAGGDIYVMSASNDGNGATAVVNLISSDGQPAWSPDGALIAFASDWVLFDGSSDIFITTLDGSRITQVTTGWPPGLPPPHLVFYRPAWSPDGRKLAAIRCRYTYDLCVTSELSIMNADGAGLTILLTGQKVSTPTWSPDGQTIAFSSAGEIGWIRSDGSERGIIVSNGHSPAWRPATSLGTAWSTSAKRDRVAHLFPFRIARAPAAPGIATLPRAVPGDRPR